MSRDTTDKRANLLSSVKALVDDPESYDAFTQAFAEFINNDAAVARALDEDEGSLFSQTLQDISLLDQRESMREDINAVLRRFNSPAVLLRHDGQVIHGNDPALEKLGLDDDSTLADLTYDLEEAEPLLSVVQNISERGSSNTGITLKTAHHRETARRATLAFLPMQIGAERAKGALLFVIDPVMNGMAVSFMAQSYGFTDSETEILTAFSDGRTLKDIAESRGRSVATIRTQFQKLLEKTGASNQADLMRTSQAMSHFVTDLGDIAGDIAHPTRKRFDVLRPGGRSVDVLMSGDPNGRPIIFMNGAFLFSFEAAIERCFAQAGLCVLAISRPGFGRTSSAPDEEDLADVIADDTKAVLAQIGTSTAPILVHSTGVPMAFRAGRNFNGVVERLVIIGGMAPPDIMRAAGPGLPMSAALLTAASTSKRLLRLLISGRHRMYLRLGAERFLARQYANCVPDRGQVARPEFIAEYDTAVTTLTAQGFDPGTEEIIFSQTQWGRSVPTFPGPVRILHGTEDPLCPIAAMELFAQRYPDKITLTPLPGAGHITLPVRTKTIIDALISP